MFEKISANAILVWFLWGLFMGMGWTIGAWVMGRLLALRSPCALAWATLANVPVPARILLWA